MGAYHGESTHSLGGVNGLEAVNDALVDVGLNLKELSKSRNLFAALDNIEGHDNSVRDSAGEDSADHALRVVRHIVNV